MRRIEALPGVTSAFASNFVPLDAGGGSGHAIVDGRAGAERRGADHSRSRPSRRISTRRWACRSSRAATSPMAKGSGKTPVAVINETMAKKLWPDADAVGRRFRLVERRTRPSWFTVIGVGARHPHVRHGRRHAGFLGRVRAVSLLRTSRTSASPFAPPAILPASPAAVRNAIRESDPGLPIFNLRTMEDLRREGFWQFRLFGFMFGIFGAAALFLAGVGVYGVLSFSVSQRTQEMGVRIALGAKQSDVLGLVVRQGVTLAAVGVVLGLVGAFGITRVIRSLLYNVTPTDPISFGGVALFLALIAVRRELSAGAPRHQRRSDRRARETSNVEGMKSPASDAAGFAVARTVGAARWRRHRSRLRRTHTDSTRSDSGPALRQRHARPGRDRHRQDRGVRVAAARPAVA